MTDVEKNEIVNSRILGYIEKYSNYDGEHARISVIGFRYADGKDYILLDEQSSKEIFPPYGKCFAYKFGWERDNILPNSFIEFSCEPSGRNSGDAYRINYDGKTTAKTFINIINVNYQTSLDNGFITQNEMHSFIDKSIFEGNSNTFFLQHNGSLYGYFKYDIARNEFLPSKGKETNWYKLDEEHYYQYCFSLPNGREYFIGKTENMPFQQVGMIDCMTDNQLSDWFRKDMLKPILEAEKIQSIPKSAFQAFSDSCKETNDTLQEIRLERIKGKLDSLEFNYNYIQDLLSVDSVLLNNLKDTVGVFREEFRKDFMGELESEKQALTIEVESLKNEKKALKFDIDTYKTKKVQKEKELEESFTAKKEKLEKQITETQFACEVIAKDYDSLVAKLKAAIPLLHANSFEKQRITSLDSIDFPKTDKTFSEMFKTSGSTFDSCFMQNILPFNIQEEFIGLFSSSSSLFKCKAVFVPSISYAYIFAKGIRNSKLFIMNVEHDWLHYEDFCNNGLLQVLESCYEKADINHVLIFDSINLTQPECGLKPFLDAISGYSLIIPMLNRPLPKNLKILATVQPAKSDMKIGLSLNPESFKNWGFVGNPNSKLALSENFLSKNPGAYCSVDELNSKLQFTASDENGDAYFGY